MIQERKVHEEEHISYPPHFQMIRVWNLKFCGHRLESCSNPFSSPEPMILLACDRNQELWEQPSWNNKGNNRILPIWFNSGFIYGTCPKWLLPELLIPAAGQKDRRLWGREWLQPLSSHKFNSLVMLVKNQLVCLLPVGIFKSIDLSRIPLQCVRTIAPEQGWGGRFHTFTLFLSTPTLTWCYCLLECGKGLLCLHEMFKWHACELATGRYG